MNMNVICKLLSGRFILTVIAGVTFAVMAIQEILDPKDALMVIMVVMTSYFQKRRTENGEGKQAKESE